MNTTDLHPGATYYIGADCGVPHTFRPIRFRLTHVDEIVGACSHLVGYELNDNGDAVEHRPIYVITAGIRLLAPPATAADLPQRRRPTNTGPARIPRPRKSPETTTGRTR